MLVHEILVRALALLDEGRRWCRAELRNEIGRHCAVGAVIDVTPGTERHYFACDYRPSEMPPEFRAAINALNDALPDGFRWVGDPDRDGGKWNAVANFNNSHDANAVVGLFCRAIEATRPKGTTLPEWDGLVEKIKVECAP